MKKLEDRGQAMRKIRNRYQLDRNVDFGKMGF
jgi:hypothetical protein